MSTNRLIIINGSLGVGKSYISNRLKKSIENSVHIKGDDFSSKVKAFSVHDEQKIEECLLLIREEINRLFLIGNKNIIVDFVFEKDWQLDILIKDSHFEISVHIFYLKISVNNNLDLIEKRFRDSIEWEKTRTLEIIRSQSSGLSKYYLGIVIDRDKLKENEIIDFITKKIKY